MQILSAILGALFNSLVGGLLTYIQTKQRDGALKDLGYTKAQRDAAVKSLKEVDAATAARDRADAAALRDPASVRRPTGFERRSG